MSRRRRVIYCCFRYVFFFPGCIQRYAGLLEISQSDMKKFWKSLNSITKRKPKSDSTLPEELKLYSGDTIHDATAIANHMNKHFRERP